MPTMTGVDISDRLDIAASGPGAFVIFGQMMLDGWSDADKGWLMEESFRRCLSIYFDAPNRMIQIYTQKENGERPRGDWCCR